MQAWLHLQEFTCTLVPAWVGDVGTVANALHVFPDTARTDDAFARGSSEARHHFLQEL